MSQSKRIVEHKKLQSESRNFTDYVLTPSLEDKQNKLTFTIPNTTNQLIYYIYNFRFTIAFFL